MFSEPQNAPEGFAEVRLVRRAEAEAAISDAYNRAIDDCIKELGVWIYTDGQCLEAIRALKTKG
jgi:hypothetical protein